MMFVLGSLESAYKDFLLLVELFSLGVTAERYERISIKNWRFRSHGVSLTVTQNFR